MFIMKNDHTLPVGVDVCLRTNEDGLMVRARGEIFETLAILGKAKMALLGMCENGKVAMICYDSPVAPSVQISYRNYNVLVSSTVENDKAIEMVNEAIEMVKKVI